MPGSPLRVDYTDGVDQIHGTDINQWTGRINEHSDLLAAIPADIILVQIGNTPRSVGTGDFSTGFYVGRGFAATKITYQFDTADNSGNTSVQLNRNGSLVTSSNIVVSSANQADSTGTDAARTAVISQTFIVGDRIGLSVTATGGAPIGKGLRAWIVGTWS